MDTCVLLQSRLSDVLFDLMLEGLYFSYWTSDVEFLRNWPQVHPDDTFMDCVPARVHDLQLQAWYRGHQGRCIR